MISENYTFKQKGFFKKRTFAISNKGVVCVEQTGLDESSYTISFEQIMEVPVERLYYSKLWLYSFVIVFSIMFAYICEALLDGNSTDFEFLGWAGAGFLVSAINFFTSRQFLVFYSLNGSISLAFLKDVPSRQAITDFMDKVFEAQDRYFQEKYGQDLPDPSLNKDVFSFADEIFKLNRLRENGAIDETEYNIAKQKLLGFTEEKRKYTLH